MDVPNLGVKAVAFSSGLTMCREVAEVSLFCLQKHVTSQFLFFVFHSVISKDQNKNLEAGG